MSARSHRARTIEDRFWAKVQKTDDCWLWTGAHGRYGFLRVGRVLCGAHRVSWEMENGPIAEGLYVCHRCDTPLCVRPDHLFVGTAKDNSQDAVSKGRIPKGLLVPSARPLTYCGVTLTLKDWAAFYGLNASTLVSRVAKGWSLEKALTEPLQ